MNKEEKFPLLFPIEKLGKISRYGTVFAFDQFSTNQNWIIRHLFFYLKSYVRAYVYLINLNQPYGTSTVHLCMINSEIEKKEKEKEEGKKGWRERKCGKEEINLMFADCDTYVRNYNMYLRDILLLSYYVYCFMVTKIF